MNLKSLLLAAGLCIGAGASAQVETGKMRQMSLEIKPRLHAVKHAPQWLDRPLRAADVRKAAGEKAVNEPAKALPARAGSSADGKQKLDSIVTINPDGSYGSLECYEYDSGGRETKSTNSYWDAAAGAWGEPVMQFDYVWTDDGLLLSEQSMIYDMGSRVEYKYNGQGLKTEQINYQTDYDGNWVAESKGEYDHFSIPSGIFCGEIVVVKLFTGFQNQKIILFSGYFFLSHSRKLLVIFESNTIIISSPLGFISFVLYKKFLKRLTFSSSLISLTFILFLYGVTISYPLFLNSVENGFAPLLKYIITVTPYLC